MQEQGRPERRDSGGEPADTPVEYFAAQHEDKKYEGEVTEKVERLGAQDIEAEQRAEDGKAQRVGTDVKRGGSLEPGSYSFASEDVGHRDRFHPVSEAVCGKE